jgi:hypothetical protein
MRRDRPEDRNEVVYRSAKENTVHKKVEKAFEMNRTQAGAHRPTHGFNEAEATEVARLR